MLPALLAIKSLESELLQMEQCDLREYETFMGALVRKIVIPKGVALTSMVYKRTYVDIMISGKITITDTNGSYELEGFNLLEGTPGRKRAGFAHEDTVWVTVHDISDIKDSPKEDITFEQIPEFLEWRKEEDKKGYELLLEKYGIDDDFIQGDMAKLPVNMTGDYILKESPFGLGVFADRRYLPGEVIGPMLIDGVKTELGRYVNHSPYPNCTYHNDHMVCIRAMDKGHEFTLNYERGLACQEL